MFILKKGHQPGVYVPLRALFLVEKKMKSNIIILEIFIKSRMSMPAISNKKYDGKPIDAN